MKGVAQEKQCVEFNPTAVFEKFELFQKVGIGKKFIAAIVLPNKFRVLKTCYLRNKKHVSYVKNMLIKILSVNIKKIKIFLSAFTRKLFFVSPSK